MPRDAKKRFRPGANLSILNFSAWRIQVEDRLMEDAGGCSRYLKAVHT